MSKLTRTVFYIRVSHQEQALHGLSLSAQRKTLNDYAEKHNLKVVGIYVDEGVSGRKEIRKRPELQRMLNDAKENKFDLILFIKLDRYFRSVAEYHECQKILTEHNVVWDATEEKYDITTANGRAFVNMKLTIAELEADQTGERIDLINEYKVSQGQALTGSTPVGFMLERREGRSYIVHDPDTEHIVIDLISHYMKYHSLRAVTLYINNKYDINLLQDTVKRLLKNPLLCGEYRNNKNYCTPYITREEFDLIQEIRSSNVKVRKNKNIYIFSGLIKCNCCNYNLSGNSHHPTYKDKKYAPILYYRCSNRYNQGKCKGDNIREDKLEKYLLDNIAVEFEKYIAKVELEEKNEKEKFSKTDISKIKKEMDRLNVMFQKNRIDESTYDFEYEILEDKLKKYESSSLSESRNLQPLKELLSSDFESIYHTLTRHNKQAFWRNIIKEIKKNDDWSFNIIFL